MVKHFASSSHAYSSLNGAGHDKMSLFIYQFRWTSLRQSKKMLVLWTVGLFIEEIVCHKTTFAALSGDRWSHYPASPVTNNH